MKIPFTKAHGARNDFLLTWRDQLPDGLGDIAAAAVAICDRHTGVGADGWLLISPGGGIAEDASIELWNSDGSRSEISGNGTRCAAALLVEANAAGNRRAHRHRRRPQASASARARDGHCFSFEMNMGAAVDRRTARVDRRPRLHDSQRRQSAVRFLRRGFRFRLAGAGRARRAPSAVSQPHQCFICARGGCATRWTSAFSNAARGKP